MRLDELRPPVEHQIDVPVRIIGNRTRLATELALPQLLHPDTQLFERPLAVLDQRLQLRQRAGHAFSVIAAGERPDMWQPRDPVDLRTAETQHIETGRAAGCTSAPPR